MENNTDKYVTTAKAREQLGVATLTLHNWAEAGKIETIRTGGGHRLYNVEKYLRDGKNKNKKNINSVEQISTEQKKDIIKPEKNVINLHLDDPKIQDKNVKQEEKEIVKDVSKQVKKENICYVRVSSVGSKNLLKKQKEYMVKKYPEYTVIEDIGSPLIFNKVGLKKIIDLAVEGKINTLVVTGSSNISSYGFEILTYFIKEKHGGKIIIDGPPEDKNLKKDIVDDVMQIMSICSEKLIELKKSMC